MSQSTALSGVKNAVCVGRFVVELPVEAAVSYGVTRIYGWEISANGIETDAEFASRLGEHENELAMGRNERGFPTLEQARVIQQSAAHGKIFVHGRQWDYYFQAEQRVDDETVNVEALLRLDGVSYRIANDSGKPHHVAELIALIGQLRTRPNGDSPKSPGFCFANAILLDPIPTVEARESTVLFASIPLYPDLAFALSTTSAIQNHTPLLQRSKESRVQAAYPAHFKRIFEGKREINGIPGEESSMKVTELNGTHGHTYKWESDAARETDVMRPFLTLELTTGLDRPGQPVRAGLPDNEVQKIWDQVSNSLRIRQAIDAAQGVEQSEEKVKAKVWAGEPCPAAGLWNCADSVEGHAVQGGAIQHFEQGVRMPQAQLLAPTSLLDKLKSHHPTFTLSTPTEWILVRGKP